MGASDKGQQLSDELTNFYEIASGNEESFLTQRDRLRNNRKGARLSSLFWFYMDSREVLT